MHKLVDMLSCYRAYHRHRWNRTAHFIGVPLIVFSLTLALAWLRVEVAGITVSVATVVLPALALWYLRLDWRFGLVTVLLWSPVIVLALRAAGPGPQSDWVFLALWTFALGWAFQFAGHLIERRRPAFVDDLSQMLAAPLFLSSEVLFRLGLRGDLRQVLERRS